ncbi:MAG: ABC transporter ATP-binding protein [Candidatus Kariarchaeaceae archaeon]|jgi:ABC-type lipoprotein export system ATPase subunit
MSSEVLLDLQHVEKEYAQGSYRVQAIKNIDLVINKGEFLVILGRSGSGKSTLLSLLGGLEQPTKGTISLNGNDLAKYTEDELAILRRWEIGIIFQHFHLMEAMTAVENVELPMLIAGISKKERRPWAIELLKLVGLDGRETHYSNELSGGERQRVGIARALANKADLIIADEPTGDLDSHRGAEIIDLLYSINRKETAIESLKNGEWSPTVVMVTHDVGMLRKGMRVLTLSDGLIESDEIFDGDYEKFDPLGNPSTLLEESYGSDEQAAK